MEIIDDSVKVVAFLLTLIIAARGSVLKADAIPPKCLTDINGQSMLKEVGEEWRTNEPCIVYTCKIDEHGNPQATRVKEICSAGCKKGFELIKEPGDCCGKCIQTRCTYGDNVYNVGQNWKSKDSCTLFECIKTDGVVSISAYKKSCPKIDNCPGGEYYEEDCCIRCKTQKLLPQFDFKSNIDDFTQYSSYMDHPCRRNCVPNSPPMICNYTFVVEWYETLSKACYDCPQDLSDCFRPHCIVGDGARRSVLVINRMMPGPAIEVCYNDTIVVDVKNHLLGESTTIHWHGIHQKETPYMDGVPHISQCPIQPHTTFRYNFKASNPGTHFWHSHTGMQRGDGSFGALIIRMPITEDAHSNLYDYDLSEHMMIVQDWAHMPGVSMFASHHHSIGSNKPPTILVNGRGRYYPDIEKNNKNKIAEPTKGTTTEAAETTTVQFVEKVDDEDQDLNETTTEVSEIEVSDHQISKRSVDFPDLIPLSTFTVNKGYSYRFRVINAEFLNCPVSISIDNHTITVISSDGYNVEPVEVSSLVTYAGERFDFILKANQEVGNYWIRYIGLMDCDERFTKAHQASILHYQGAKMEEPLGTPSYDFKREGIELNSLNKGPGSDDTIVITDLHALDDDDDWNIQAEPDHRFYVYYDFYPKDNPHFHVPNLYGFNQVKNPRDNKLFTPQLNHISLKFPSSPLMPYKDQIDESTFCNESSLAAQGINCRKEFCECSHVLQVALGSVVEMVLIDEGVTYDANHPFHLHGNAFRVIGMDRLKKDVSVEEVKEMDKQGLFKRKLHRAPIKDTVTIPDGGYTIIRYKADNPGYWLFHCHIEFHAEIGMALIMKVGESHEMVSVPTDFPTCSDYVPEVRMNDGSGAAVRIYDCNLIVPIIILTILKYMAS